MKIATTLFTTAFFAAANLASATDCGDTIYDIAKDDSRFDTLQAALELTGLDDVLDGDGPFTVFAPTDDAFDDLPNGLLDDLLHNEHALTDILLYHVVSGEAFSTDLSDGDRIRTVVGRKVKVSIDGSDIEIDKSNVILADVEACNGVIHAIDKVLIPKIKYVGHCDDDDKCGFCEGEFYVDWCII